MPLYDYKCPMCKHEEERFATISKRHSQACPKCGDALVIKPSAPRIMGQFKDENGNEEVPFEDFDIDSALDQQKNIIHKDHEYDSLPRDVGRI